MNNDVIQTTTLTIASGAALSDALSLNGRSDHLAGLRLFGIIMPAAWTAADLTFQVSDDGVTWRELKNPIGDLPVLLNVSAAGDYRFSADLITVFSSVGHVKVRSGLSATPVNQGADRAVTLILRSV